MSNALDLSRLGPVKDKIDAAMKKDLAVTESPLLAEVLEHAIFNGGKRIRPLLTVIAARITQAQAPEVFSEGREKDLYRLAMVFEYLHAASLLHDDVIDHAEQRRGKRSANVIWGNTPVILAGDFLHTRAMQLAGSIGGRECLDTVAKATSAMVEAEFLQMQNAENRNLAEADYFGVLQGKTAALIASACETGVIFAKGDDQQQQALRTYGSSLGLAFQIADDLLDYLGDPSKTGKIVGNDLMEGKMTLPLIYAMTKGDASKRKELLGILNSTRQARAESFDMARELIKACNGFMGAREKAEQLINSAQQTLEIFPDSDEKNILLNLSDYVLARNK